MKLKHVLTPSCVCVDLKGTTKEEILAELLDILMKGGKVKDRSVALKGLQEREQKMSTGIQYGVAIPHAKCSAVDELVACIGISKSGVDFQALDGQKSNLFFMTLSPENKTGPHVQFLAEISMVVKTQEARDRLLAATDAAQVLAVFGL